MDDSSGVPTRIVGRRPIPAGRQRAVLVTVAALYTAFVIWELSHGRWSITGGFFAWVVWFGVIFFRKPTVVDSSGIRRPWRLRSSVAWGEVDRVASPQTGIGRVRLWMKNGKTLNLDDVAVDESTAVAEIGGVPLGFSPRQHVRPPSRPHQRTDRDIEADVARRAQMLAERGRQLDAEYRSIQRRSSPPDQARPDEPD